MNLLTVYATSAVLEGGAQARNLYEAFLAGRSAHTRDAYSRDMATFAAYRGEATPVAALERLLAISAGKANGIVLAYRSHMADAGLAPATVNRRLAAINSAVKLARTLGFTAWTPEVSGLKAQSYRDTRGPGLSGTRSMLEMAQT